MKKIYPLALAALFCIPAMAKSNQSTAEDAGFDASKCHSPRYTAGKLFENLLGPDMIANQTKNSEIKPGIADIYQWIEYINPTSTLDNGKGEVQQSNRWTNYDPSFDDYNYGTGANWIQVKNAAGSANSPVLSSEWGKYMVAYVKDTKRVELLGIGSASGSAEDGNNIYVLATSSDGTETLEFTSKPGGIYGKGTASDTLCFALNPEKEYMLTIKGNETVQKDIMIANIRLYGTSEVAGVATYTAKPSFTYCDVVVGPDMIATKSKTNPETQVSEPKPGISDDYPWIVYINPTSTLDDGTAEVQQSNRWTDLDPRTGVKGEFIQAKGKNGSVNSPVLVPSWGKYMKFYVTGTNKFTVYGAGSASGSADDKNHIIVTAYPFNSNDSVVATSTPGGIYGKGTASDLVSVELNENEKYEIKVEAAVKDIQLTGINMGNAQGDANKAAGSGTLNLAINAAADNAVIDLEGESWTLFGAATLGQKGLTIQNGTIITDSLGQIVVKKSIILDGIKMNTIVTPIVMANKDALTAADTAAFATWSVESVAAVYYTEEEVAAYNTEHAQEITDGELEALTVETIKEAAKEVTNMKYPNAANKVFEAKMIAIRNSEIKTASSIVSGGNAPWALRTLEINNSIIETSAKSGKAFINWEEGASQIKDIVIKNTTLFADSVNTDQRFHRYTAQVDPWRVWGYEGEDKNAPGLNTWTLENNTIVNLCGNKEFSNNMKNTAATTFTFKGNAFANSWRINKLGSNVTRNFVVTDNAICGGVNTVDGTDASKWATEDKEMAVVVNDSVKNFIPDAYSWTGMQNYGDPRWASQISERTEISRMLAGVDTLVLKNDVKYTLNAPAIAMAEKVVVIEGNGASITAGAEGQFIVRQGLVLDSVKLDASASSLAPIAQAAKESLTAADTTAFATWSVESVAAVYYTEEEVAAYNTEHAQEITDGELEALTVETIKEAAKEVTTMKYENASNKVFESQLIAIRNSEVKTASSIVSGGNAPWALRTLEINNSIIETSAKSGKAFINWEEGASQIKDIVIKNSTLFGDSVNTEQRFHRYTAQVDPWRVWGYEGEDKNAPGLNTWILENNTIVNLCGNKEFSNNIKNTAATAFTFKGNVFVNSWRINKLGSNVTRNFDVADNAIAGGVNDVDGTDASKWATIDTLLNINYTLGAEIDFHPGQSSYAAKMQYGDPRWAVEYVEPTGIENVTVARKSEVIMFNLAGQRVNNAKGLVIKNGRKMIIK